jgi:DNA-binding NarL/FixJ family response regulator
MTQLNTEKRMSNTRVLIVEDDPVIASDIEICLLSMDYFVCGKAYKVSRAHDMLSTTYPDIVLLDINLSGGQEGIDLGRMINETYQIPFIFLTSYADKNTIQEAKQVQPWGYIVKPYNPKDLFATLEIALFNHAQNRKKNIETLSLEKLNEKLYPSVLTQREYDLWLLLIEGYSNQKIGEQLFLSINTIKSHLKTLYLKLGVNSRTAAIKEFMDLT